MPAKSHAQVKPAPARLHPRNRHQGQYDFAALIAACPALKPHVKANAHGQPSIDFASPQAVKLLNRALLAQWYGIQGWDIPAGYLCPPIPGRADYIHSIADLLAGSQQGRLPQGPAIRLLDIGTGANLVYPLLAHAEYGWNCVGADIDRPALANAQAILQANPALASQVELRHQTRADAMFGGIIRPGERFDVTVCNPPFHASRADAAAGSLRKWRQLGKQDDKRGARNPLLNFGGQQQELCYPGGERAFVAAMIAESTRFARQCCWFTSLLSSADNLPALQHALRAAGARQSRVVAMAQGQKRSRLLAWSFLDQAGQQAWAARYWQEDSAGA
ncbi:ribosomal RNA large subunit methyltransferase F [Aquitalea magnusonii]|uniref:Ribosomal RNA large subunit methyltransferase F n=1 Tax=Aquitalea magnusonii TaxID=332411 RepID=A0A3G9GB47_9NEIS|nr:23S rRNA (adenine(1618)-N(6))-methyltransferase RlmF [Aquitalea magnusonii]BBF84604.1 ribosomal RNA large subunit methyltransferase F [Aquitalea magnusonii]